MKDKDITDTIYRLFRALKRQKRQGGKRPPFSRSSYRIMVILKEEESMRMGELAKRLDIRPASLSPQLKQMEAAGLIKRQRDENDLRGIRLTLDQEGEKVLDQVRGQRERRSKEINAWLTPEEREEFLAVSEKLIAAFESNQKGQEGGRHES